MSYKTIDYLTVVSKADHARNWKRQKEGLINKWNIICDSDCVCKDPTVDEAIARAYALTLGIRTYETNPAELLAIFDKIPMEGLYGQGRATAYWYNYLLYTNVLLKYGKMSESEKKMKIDRARECIEASYNINFAHSPFSWNTVDTKQKLESLKQEHQLA